MTRLLLHSQQVSSY